MFHFVFFVKFASMSNILYKRIQIIYYEIRLLLIFHLQGLVSLLIIKKTQLHLPKHSSSNNVSQATFHKKRFTKRNIISKTTSFQKTNHLTKHIKGKVAQYTRESGNYTELSWGSLEFLTFAVNWNVIRLVWDQPAQPAQNQSAAISAHCCWNGEIFLSYSADFEGLGYSVRKTFFIAFVYIIDSTQKISAVYINIEVIYVGLYNYSTTQKVIQVTKSK